MIAVEVELSDPRLRAVTTPCSRNAPAPFIQQSNYWAR